MQPEQQAMHDRIFYLRRRIKPRSRAAGGLLELAPWVDVVLIVILFFMIHTATLVKPGVEIDLPIVPVSGGARYDTLVVTVPHDQALFFMDEQMTEEVFAERLAEQQRLRPGRELVIEADGSVSYHYLSRIYNVAVQNGFERIVMATRLEPRGVMSP